MSTYTPYQAGMTTSGTWTYVGTPSPNPTPPATYNAAIDFATYAAGLYVYRYTVTSGAVTHAIDVSINWQGDGTAPGNDTCAGARFITGLIDCPGSGNISYTTAKQCSLDIAAPTDSGVTLPATWTLPSYSGDLWYRIVPPSCVSPYQLVISTVGAGNANDAQGVGLAVYDGSCASLTEVGSGTSNSNETDFSISVNVPANYSGLYYIRIANATAGAGTLQVQCTNSCTSTTPNPITLYHTSYVDDTAATTGGIGFCSPYRLNQINNYTAISPGSKILYVSRNGGCNSYVDDAAAQAAGIPLGGIYAIADANNYSLPSPGGRLAVVRTDGGTVTTFKGPFIDDATAAAGGVVIGEPYLAHPQNIYTMPSGGGRTLIVRTN